jgi:hypothetical protein
MAGIIFAKFTVPRNRGETIIFSKNAVISMRNGSLYLMCRVSDLRKAGLLEAHVRMIVIKKEKTEEGEIIPYQVDKSKQLQRAFNLYTNFSIWHRNVQEAISCISKKCLDKTFLHLQFNQELRASIAV